MTIESMTPERAKLFMATTVTASLVSCWPPYVGGYKMGDITFNLTHKPSAWHRWWVRFTLGWTWEDNA